MSRLRLVGKCLGVSYLLLALAVLGKRHREDNSVHNRLSSALGRCGGRAADVNSLRDHLPSLLDHYVSTWIYLIFYNLFCASFDELSCVSAMGGMPDEP
jgi:hypothetical protein